MRCMNHCCCKCIANRVRTLRVLSRVISHADRYRALLRSLCHFLGNFRDYMILHWPTTREIIARIYIYMLKCLRFRPQTPSSRTISALNSANVGVLLSTRYVKPRIVCKRNDAAFVGEFVPLIPPPGPIHWTDLLVNYSQSPLNGSLLRWRRHYGVYRSISDTWPSSPPLRRFFRAFASP